MTENRRLTDVELRVRTETLLAEASKIAHQLKVQTERLSNAIDLFHDGKIAHVEDSEVHET